MATCPNCGNETSEGAVFCDRCGTRLPAPLAAAAPVPAAAPAPVGGSVICPACGAGNVPGEAFCDYCGSPLDAPAPAPAVAPAIEAAAPETPAPEPVAPVEAPVAPEAPAAPAPPAAPVAQNICPACAAAVLPNEAFCANCGASLAQAPIAPEPVAEVEAAALPEVVPVAPPPIPAPEAVAPAPEAVAPAPEAAAPAPVAAAPAPVAAAPAPEPAAPEPVPAAPPAPAPAAAAKCPACGVEIEPGDAFCSSCGFALQAVTPPAAPAPAPAPVAAAPALGARLVVSASGAEIPLPPGNELLIGREDPVSGIYPEVDLTPHGGEEGGVSRRHARIVLENGEYYVEDLDSTNFTFVNKQKVAPKTRQRIVDGDEIRTGRVGLVFRK